MLQIEKSVNIQKEPVKTREKDDDLAILKEAKERIAKAYSYFKDNYIESENDIYAINEDSEDIVDEDNRLTLRFKRLPQFINRVVGAQRNEVQSINVSPTSISAGESEPVLTTDKGEKVKLSDVLTDLVRDIEYNSNAIAAYKQAFKQALEGGFGWLRVLTEYEKDSFNLNIRIKGIRNRWSVLVDPDTQETDMSDMDWAFISEKISREEFKKRYPGKSAEPLSSEESETYWGDEETVTVTEYFRREPYKKTIALLSNGQIVNLKDIDQKQLTANGISIVKKRTERDYRVIWCKLSASDILEGEIEFPSTTIPIVPVLGRIIDTKNKRRFRSLIHDAIDSQYALNKIASSAVERIDTSPLSPFIATDKAIEGYEHIWQDANRFKYSTLPYRKGEERPQREQGATVPVAEINLIPVLEDGIKSSVGLYDASLGQRSNETSGIAIQKRQQEGDAGTYEFIDNYRNAIRRIGIIVTEIIPKIYDTNRIITLRKLDNTTDTIEINKPVKDMFGQTTIVNTLKGMKHTVHITAGATYNTKREENAQQILDLMRVNPEVAQVGSDLLVRNLDFSESNVLADRLEKTIPPNLLSKEQREKIAQDQPQQQQPSPEQIKMQAEAQKGQMQIEIEKIKLAIEQIKLEQAKLQAQESIATINEQRKDKIAETVAKLASGKNA